MRNFDEREQRRWERAQRELDVMQWDDEGSLYEQLREAGVRVAQLEDEVDDLRGDLERERYARRASWQAIVACGLLVQRAMTRSMVASSFPPRRAA